ncbi:MAG: hypothetical protein RLZZ238_226 [Planctomycetota bacterium]
MQRNEYEAVGEASKKDQTYMTPWNSNRRTVWTHPTDHRPVARRVRSAVFALMAGFAIGVVGCDRTGGGPGQTDSPAEVRGQAAAAPATQQSSAPVGAGATASDEPFETIDGPPPLRVEPDVLDFGILPPSVSKDGVVKLINTGDRELEVLTVQPSCKCTTLEDLSGRKIPVGGSIELKATMKAQSSPGKKGAELKVLIDGYTQVVPIQLKQEVSLPIRVSPSYLNVVKGMATTGRTVIESIDKQPFTICAVGGKKPNLVGFDPEKDAPRSQYLLDWDFERDFAPGEAKRYWLIETDRADCPLVDIFVRHESTIVLPRGIAPTEYRHTFGRMEQGQSYEFVLELTKLTAGETIVAAASSSSAARVELVDSKIDGETGLVTLRVVPDANTLGLTWIPFMVYSSTGRQVEQAVWGQYVPKGHTGCFGR